MDVRCRVFDAAICPDGVLPQAEGVTHVGGVTADAVDFPGRLVERVVWFVGFVGFVADVSSPTARVITAAVFVLVPAAMVVAGRRAWWMPHWVSRLLPCAKLEKRVRRTSGCELDRVNATSRRYRDLCRSISGGSDGSVPGIFTIHAQLLH